MAKLAPPTPRNTPSTSSTLYVGTNGSSSTNAGIAESAIPSSASLRPSTDWNRLPSVTRTIEAASTGTATRNADSVADSEICLEMKGASGPNMTQTVNPVSKYRKQASSAFQLPLLSDAIRFFMRSSSRPKAVPSGRKKTLRLSSALSDPFRAKVRAKRKIQQRYQQARYWACTGARGCNAYASITQGDRQ